MQYLPMIGQLFLSLSILIVLHELGHFLPAKWFNTRVEKFYLFFDPYFSLFKYKKGDTEYGIGWLPLGGYVKISGMIDESMDKEQMEGPPQPWEFRSKPTWQRLIIMLGGVTVNFLLGFLIYGMVLWSYGEEFLPNQNVKYGIATDSLAQEMGLMDGDQIVKVGDAPFERFSPNTIRKEIVLNSANTIEVIREGRIKVLPIDESFIGILGSNANKGFRLIEPRTPFIIGALEKGYPAAEAGLKEGDQVISYNGIATPFFMDFFNLATNNPNARVDVGFLRGTDTMTVQIVTREDGRIGAQRYGLGHFFDFERKEYSLAEALPAGFWKGVNFLGSQFKGFGQMFAGKVKVTESLGGFGTFTKLFPEKWGDWEAFWNITALISLILAFMNLLPIPALDGGHVMFLLYEMITGRKPSDKFMEYATIGGFIFVLSLVLLANGLDIYRGWFQ